ADGLHVPQVDRVRFPDLQHHRGIEHVLGRGAEMDVFAVIPLAQLLHRFHRRHQRMLDAADFSGNRIDVDFRDAGVGGNVLGGGFRNDPQPGLLDRQCRLEIEPLLHAVVVVEYGAQLLGAPQVLDQCVVKYSGCHGGLQCLCSTADQAASARLSGTDMKDSIACQNLWRLMPSVAAWARPDTNTNCLSLLGSLPKKSSRSGSAAMPSYSPRMMHTGQVIFRGSITGRFAHMSR